MHIIIDATSAHQRLDRFCRKYFKPYSHITLKDIYHWIRKWWIKVNNKRSEENRMLEIGDQIIFHSSIQEQLVDKKELKDNAAYIEHWMHHQWLSWNELIVYEDENWLVRNKPVGIVAHEGNKHTEDITMNQLLQSYMKLRHWIENITSDTFQPAYAFRLDKDTSWVLISAKTYPALQYINALIRDHTVEKKYIAWVVGHIDMWTIAKNYWYVYDGELLTIDEPLFKWFSANTNRAHVFVNHEKWLPSITKLKILQEVDDDIIWLISLIECTLLTGRMHQIRAHLAHIWCPIIWDIQYGEPVINRLANKKYHITRQLLHSYQYSFMDTMWKFFTFTASIPSDFYKFDI